MRKWWWLVAGLTVVAVQGRPAEACQCATFDEAEETAKADVVFDGWVLSVPTPWHCAVPPAPKAKPGCVRIAVVEPTTCKSGPGSVLLVANGEPLTNAPTIEDDAATFCNIKPGRYVAFVGEGRTGTEDGTTAYGRTLDLAPGRSYVLFGSSGVGQKLRIGVSRVIKGSVAREVTAFTKPGCGTKLFAVGEAERFFGKRAADGSIDVSGCWGSRELREDEREEQLAAIPPTAPAAAAPPTPAPPAATPAPQSAKRSSGCATSSPEGVVPALFVIVLLGVRLRCFGQDEAVVGRGEHDLFGELRAPDSADLTDVVTVG